MSSAPYDQSKPAGLKRETQYRYTKLKGPQWTRIVKLRPAPEDQPNIECEIIERPSLKSQTAHVDSSNAVNDNAADGSGDADGGSGADAGGLPNGYEAVSWCWGNDEKDESIRIIVMDRAQEFKLSPHLYQALYCLRDTVGPRYLWIDSLCIDQENVEERNQQVPRMSEIYGEARNVCIWLGKGTSESTQAFNFIRNELKSPWNLDSLWKGPKHHESAGGGSCKRATVHCGRDVVNWTEFETAVSVFVELEQASRHLQVGPANDVGAMAVTKDRSIFREVPHVGASALVDTTSRLLRKTVAGIHKRSIPLEELVTRLAAQETSEPRDVIYALLALAKDTQPSLEGVASHIDGPDGRRLSPQEQKTLQLLARSIPNPSRRLYMVDYKQPIVDVYQQFIAFALSRADPTRALDVILRPFARTYRQSENYTFDKIALQQFKDSGVPDRDAPLPSWIPDAKSLPFRKQLHRRGTFQSGGSTDHPFVPVVARLKGESFVDTTGSRQTSYCAAGTRAYDKNKVFFRKRRDHYSLFAEGFILDRIKAVESPATNGHIPKQWFVRWRPRESEDWDTVWKTLVANRDGEGRNPPPFYASALHAAFQGRKDASFDIDHMSNISGSELVAKALQRVKSTIYERCLIETDRGMLGLADSDVEVNDLVCIFYGCSVPVILRRSEQKQPRDIEDEQEQDEADWRVRLGKSQPLLKKILARRRKRLGQVGRATRANTGFDACDTLPESSVNGHNPPDPALPPTNPEPSDAASPAGGENRSEEQAVAGAEDDRDSHVVEESTSGPESWWKTTYNRLAVHLADQLVLLRLVSLPLFVGFTALFLKEPMAASVLTTVAGTHILHDLLLELVHDTTVSTALAIGILAMLCAGAPPVFDFSRKAFIVLALTNALLYPEMFPPTYRRWHRWCVVSVLRMVETTGAQESDVPEDGRKESDRHVPESVDSDNGMVLDRSPVSPMNEDSAQASKGGASLEEPLNNGSSVSDTAAQSIAIPLKAVPKLEDMDVNFKPLKHFYTLIGEAYVHGMMDGEAIELQNESVFSEHKDRMRAEIFEIR